MLMKNWENGQAFITGIYIYHKAKLANRFYWSIKILYFLCDPEFNK